MPLESFTGSSVDTLLRRARASLGSEAQIIAVRAIREGDGRPVYQVLATDAAGAADERRRMAPDGGSHPLLKCAPVAEDLARQRAAPGAKVLAFVGPTGVGKTTTIAKLATHPDFFRCRRVGFLTLDTYRVGAVEQLRVYAEIARLPLEVIYDAAELPAAMRRLSDRDLILVDSPGRGPAQKSDAMQVRQWLTQIGPSEVHLVLPAGLQPDLVRRSITAYRDYGVTHLLPTKLDEAPDDWTLFDAAAEARIPMRWLSDGQEVPRDLRAAAPRLLSAVAALRVRMATSAEVVG